MIGLLYTNYISTFKGKNNRLFYLVTLLFPLFLVILAIFFHFIFFDDLYLSNDTGEKFYLPEMMHASFFGVLIIVSYGELVNRITEKIILDDNKKMIKCYIDAMPLKKHSYVASKYLYVGIACCFVSVVLLVSGLICKMFYMNGFFKEFFSLMLSFIPLFAGLSFFVASVELPLFLRFGNEKALLIKLTLFSVIALFIIGFFMFGDLHIFDGFDLTSFMEWLKAQKAGFTTFKIAAPLISVALFYLSFKISCLISSKTDC